jgi:hypothetical protein
VTKDTAILLLTDAETGNDLLTVLDELAAEADA